jgi:hypothetical protein
MNWSASDILDVLDSCSKAFEFPMLDNGYVYLAKTRLSLFRSDQDWALVFEVFGFSPRAGYPDTSIQTFASRLHNRQPPVGYATKAAYDAYLDRHPHNEYSSVYPIEEGEWQDPDNYELVAVGAKEIRLRGRLVQIPDRATLDRFGITMEQAPRLAVFELCRFLADTAGDQLLATEQECRTNVLPELSPLLRLDEWNHPDLAAGAKPSDSETFRQLAEVLASGDAALYRSTQLPNTHWRNWPEGGRL